MVIARSGSFLYVAIRSHMQFVCVVLSTCDMDLPGIATRCQPSCYTGATPIFSTKSVTRKLSIFSSDVSQAEELGVGRQNPSPSDLHGSCYCYFVPRNQR